MTTILYDETIYRDALKGNLKSKPSEKDHKIILHNRTHLPIGYCLIDQDGNHGETATLLYDKEVELKTHLDVYYLITNALSGAFVAVFKVRKDHEHYDFVMGQGQVLFEPNNIGMPPEASKSMVIPRNSWSIVTGLSFKQDGKKKDDDIEYIAVREQSWDMSPTSYSLSPQEKKTISVTHETGRTSDSSDQESISATVGTNVSAGWGPASASISASLSASASFSHDVSIEESTTSYHMQELYNSEDTGKVVYFWKLADSVTLYKLASSGSARDIAGHISYNLGPMIPIAYSVSGTNIKPFKSPSDTTQAG